jgi:hypothetical protein
MRRSSSTRPPGTQFKEWKEFKNAGEKMKEFKAQGKSEMEFKCRIKLFLKIQE